MAGFIAFVILTVGVAVIVTVVTRIRNENLLRVKLVAGFGKMPALDEEGRPESLSNLESIARYAEMMTDEEPGPWRLDATTWNDLDMDKVFGRVNVCQSSVGEEYLYNCLHELQRNDRALLEREQLVDFFESHGEERVTAQMALARVGKENFNGLVRLMFDADDRYLKHQHIFGVLAVLPIVGAAFLLFHVPLGFIVLFGSFITNIIVHNRVKNALESDMPAVEYLHGMLVGCKRLCDIKTMENLPAMVMMRRCFAFFKSVMNKLPSSQNKGGLMDYDFLLEYLRVLFLLDLRNYNKLVRAINEHSKEFQGLFNAMGEVETALCVLNLRKTLPTWCAPDFHKDATIQFEGLVHPLLNAPVPNTGEIANDSLLTGSNASGKSTFVKALALGGVLAQTLYTCAAARFQLRFSWVLTSMVLRDDIGSGDSYFVVEIKSLRRIVERVKEHPCTCYIDEILRGTNTVERIAASASVLGWLAAQPCLTVAATHDIELTHMLASSYENFHFREQVTDAGVEFDYTLKHGPATTRNAIKLLEVMDFDPGIVAQAQKMAREYDTNQKWEG